MARFVEETYRGEPQTPSFGRLTLYHWMAIVSALAGAVVTCLPGAPAPPLSGPALSTCVFASAMGVLFGLAMGVDLPRSTLRFSRLSG
jgi:drug/metabolite transporter (DMT)-like permease